MDIRETPSSTVKVSQDGVNLSENSENGQQVYPPKPVINTDTVSNHIDGKRYLELTSIRRSNNQLIGWHNSGADTDMTTTTEKCGFDDIESNECNSNHQKQKYC